MSTPASYPSSPDVPASTTLSGSVAFQALMAIVLGLFIVGFAGFSHLDAVHNASHDTRHSNAFPCH